MPQVSRFNRLPINVQREVEQQLIENGFSDYAAIAADLRRRGYRISKSALHREGKQIKGRVKELRDQHLARTAGFPQERGQ